MQLSTVLLSGDNESAAPQIAKQVGIDMNDVRANVKPAGKADAIRELQNRKSQIRKSQIHRRHGRRRHQRCARPAPRRTWASRSAPARTSPRRPATSSWSAAACIGIATAIRLSRATMTQDPAESFLRIHLQRAGDSAGRPGSAESADRRGSDGVVGCHRDRKCPAFAGDRALTGNRP